MSNNRIIKLPEVILLTSIPKSTIYAYIKNGDFPKQVQLTKKSVGWRYADIQQFINNRPLVT